VHRGERQQPDQAAVADGLDHGGRRRPGVDDPGGVVAAEPGSGEEVAGEVAADAPGVELGARVGGGHPVGASVAVDQHPRLPRGGDSVEVAVEHLGDLRPGQALLGQVEAVLDTGQADQGEEPRAGDLEVAPVRGDGVGCRERL